MSGLFFSFETNSLMSFSQMSLLLIFLLPCYSFYFMKSRVSFLFSKMLTFFKSEFKPLFGINYLLGSMIIFLGLFLFIVFMNIQGLFSYTFTWSSHLLYSFSLGFPVWLSILLMGITNSMIKNLSHLVPNNTPFPLMSFMVLIETLSVFIRPITLSVRLAANITAGHLLLSLISWSSSYYMVNLLAQLMMFMLEIMVSIIQSYVFTMLLILYMEEEN